MMYVTTGGKIVLTPAGKIALECCCTPTDTCNCCCDPTVAPWYQTPLTITITEVYVSGAADKTILDCIKGTWVLPYGKIGEQVQAPQPGDPPVTCYWSNTFCAGPDDDSGIFYMEASVEQKDDLLGGSSNFKCLNLKIELVSCQDCRNQVLLYKPTFLMTVSAEKCGETIEHASLNPLPEYASLNLTDELEPDLGEDFPYDLGGCGCNENLDETVLNSAGTNIQTTDCWDKEPGVFAGYLHISNIRWEPAAPVDLAAVSLSPYQKQIAFTKAASATQDCQWELIASEDGFYPPNADPLLNGNLVVTANSDLFYTIRVGTGYTDKGISFPLGYVFTPRPNFQAEVGCRYATKRKNQIGSIYNTVSGLTYTLYADFEYDMDPYGSYHYSFDINVDPLACPANDKVVAPCQCIPAAAKYSGKVGVLRQRYFPAATTQASSYTCSIDSANCHKRLYSSRYLASRPNLAAYGGVNAFPSTGSLETVADQIVYPTNKTNCVVVSFEKDPPEIEIANPSSDTNGYASLQKALPSADKAPIGARFEILISVAGKLVSIIYEKSPTVLLPGYSVGWVMHPNQAYGWVDAQNRSLKCPIAGYSYEDGTHVGGQGIALCSSEWGVCNISANTNAVNGLNKLKTYAEIKPGRIPATSLHEDGVATTDNNYGILHTHIRAYTRTVGDTFADSCCQSVLSFFNENLASCNAGDVATGKACSNYNATCVVGNINDTTCTYMPITYGTNASYRLAGCNIVTTTTNLTTNEVSNRLSFLKSRTYGTRPCTGSGTGNYLLEEIRETYYVYDGYFDEFLKQTEKTKYNYNPDTCAFLGTTNTSTFSVIGSCGSGYSPQTATETLYNSFGQVIDITSYRIDASAGTVTDPWTDGDRATLLPIINEAQTIRATDIHPTALANFINQNTDCIIDSTSCIQGILYKNFNQKYGVLHIAGSLGILSNGINSIFSDTSIALKVEFKIANGNVYCVYLPGGATRTVSKIANTSIKRYLNTWSGFCILLDPVCFTDYPVNAKIISAAIMNGTYNTTTGIFTPTTPYAATRTKDEFVWDFYFETGFKKGNGVGQCVASGDLDPPAVSEDPPLFAVVMPERSVQDSLDSLIYNV